MARRSDHTRDELYELVLAEARRIAEAQGLKGLTARRIAHGIGYSPGTIYNLFDDLDDLIVHLNARTLDELGAHLSGFRPGADPEAALMQLARAYIDFTRAHPRLWALLFEHGLPEGRELPAWHLDRIETLLGLISQALVPLFGPDEAAQRDHCARVLWSCVQGIVALASAGRLTRSESVEGLVRSLVHYHVAGLRASKTHPHFEN